VDDLPFHGIVFTNNSLIVHTFGMAKVAKIAKKRHILAKGNIINRLAQS
jgi:hypothetical protein